MIQSVDESLGRLMDSLEHHGLSDNTIIVLTSNHGGLSSTGINNNRELATSNLPLRGEKGHLYEGGVRVPMIVKWPGNASAGTKSEARITGTDYYPAFLDMAG